MSALVATLLATLSVSAVFTAPDVRPNVLVIIADDWSWPHAGVYGDPVVKTPHFDAVAASGAVFTKAHCVAPTCSASRAALLTGKHPHRLGPGANLWGILPVQHATYPDLLAQVGYVTAHTGKGWGPGTLDGSGRSHNPAGPSARSFAQFLKTVPGDKPFCFWHGSQDPHRPYEPGSGRKAGLDPQKVVVPKMWPDTEVVRDDILDYMFEVQRFDTLIGDLLKTLEESGRAENTLVIITSDNGMPFPRAKANLYNAGTHVPLAMRWPKGIREPHTVKSPVMLVDVTATILNATGVSSQGTIDGRNLLDLIGGKPNPPWRFFTLVERERHADVREGSLGYPARAIQTKNYLYIRNYEPSRWPAGDPKAWRAVGPFGDVDDGPTKQLLVKAWGTRNEASRFAELALGKRQREELYSIDDVYNLKNLANDPAHANAIVEHGKHLDKILTATADPRANGPTPQFDAYTYVGPGIGEKLPPLKPPVNNALTTLEIKHGWQLLFDGKTLNGWTTERGQPSKTPISESTINPHKSGGYMLIYETPMSDFVLSLDFKITPQCNSGVFIRTEPLTPRSGKDVGFNGIEIAIDDTTTAGFHDTGAIYDLVKPSHNAMKPVGQWNHMTIVCDRNLIFIEVNGQLVTRMNLDQWTTANKRPDGSDHKFDIVYKNHPRSGYIGLQDHGSQCFYKNIKFLPLPRLGD